MATAAAPAPTKKMDELEEDFGYHSKFETEQLRAQQREAKEARSATGQLRANFPMTIAMSSVCGVLIYGLWKSLLANDDPRESTKSQAKWMGFRVYAQGAAFVSLFGFAWYSGRLFSESQARTPLPASRPHQPTPAPKV